MFTGPLSSKISFSLYLINMGRYFDTVQRVSKLHSLILAPIGGSSFLLIEILVEWRPVPFFPIYYNYSKFLIQYCYFVAQIVPVWAIRSSWVTSGWPLCPLTCSYPFFWALLCGAMVVFLFFFLIGKWQLETDLGTRCAYCYWDVIHSRLSQQADLKHVCLLI